MRIPFSGKSHSNPSEPTKVTPTGAASAESSSGHKWLKIVAAGLLAVVLPALIVTLLVGDLGVTAFFVGLLLGAVGAKIGGSQRMLILAPLLAVSGGLGAITAYDWWWAALLAIEGVIVGGGLRVGWFPALLMLPYAAAFVAPVSNWTDAAIYGVILGLASLYGLLIARHFGAKDVVDSDQLALPAAVGVAVAFGAVLGSGAAIGVALGWTEPYWVAEPILILVLYIVLGKRDKILGKAIGTSLGIAAAIPVALLDPPAGVQTSLGLVAFLLALSQARTYWLMYGLYTFSLVLLLATPGQVGVEAEERGVQILVGVGLLVVGLFVAHWFVSWVASRERPGPLTTDQGAA